MPMLHVQDCTLLSRTAAAGDEGGSLHQKGTVNGIPFCWQIDRWRSASDSGLNATEMGSKRSCAYSTATKSALRSLTQLYHHL